MSTFDTLEDQLNSVYSEIMWLARRPGVTPSMARAWYTHVFAERLKKRIRIFTGLVSAEAIEAPKATLRLEHHHRIQTTLTQLVERHIAENIADPTEFVETVIRCESVHIVTFRENYDVQKTDGDYAAAGVKLIEWRLVEPEVQQILWKKMLRNKVANAYDFVPRSNNTSGNKQ